ncbi:MAG: hypothetical protein KDD35_00360, partial [Bdellovibrionales bacterium]|nr:hypothetical protein [Bdellovibrionales bacterium]
NSLGVQGDVPQTFISGKLNFLPTEALGKPNSGVSVSKMTQALVETGTYTARLRSDFNSGKADPSITAEVVDLAEQMVNVAAPTYVDALKTMDSLTGGQGLTSVDAQTRVALKTPALTSVFASVQLEAVLKESIEVKDLAAMKGYVARMRDLSQLVRSQQPIVNLFNQVENPTVANAKAVAFEKACGI